MAPVMSPTKRTFLGPHARTPADRSGPDTPPSKTAASDAVDGPPGSASPTAEAAANRKTSRLEWPLDTDFSLILFSLSAYVTETRENRFPPPCARLSQAFSENLQLDWHLTTRRVALKFPGSTRAKTRSGAEGVFHELHVGDLPVLHFEQNRERRSYRFSKFCRGIGETPKDGSVFGFTKNLFGSERIDDPKLRHIVKSLDDRIRPVVSAAPWHDFVEVGIRIVERDVDYVRCAQLFDNIGISDALQKRLHAFLRIAGHFL